MNFDGIPDIPIYMFSPSENLHYEDACITKRYLLIYLNLMFKKLEKLEVIGMLDYIRTISMQNSWNRFGIVIRIC